jgi:cyclophilin family peptidyl-prolyl cis-trans isomerase/protein-disulfide isomerase
LQTIPTPRPEDNPLFPPVAEDEPTRGPEDASATIIEYCDFQAEGCAALAQTLEALEDAHPEDLRVAYRAYPLLRVNDKAGDAFRFAEAARLQGKFWEAHDFLFENQEEWRALSADAFDAWIRDAAKTLGLDEARFEADFQRNETLQKVEDASRNGEKAGIPGVPFLLINGQIYGGPINYESLDSIIRLISLGSRQFDSCPPMTIDPTRQYLATLHTEKGDIVIQLFADKAPLTVNNFVFLARQGWFDGVTFHRVIPGFVAQTGDPSGTGRGNPGYFFADEIDPSLHFDKAGMVGMANSGPNTNGCQFFITYAPQPQLDGSFTIFGEVLQGMEVLENLTPRNPQMGVSLPPGDKILRVTIEER